MVGPVSCALYIPEPTLATLLRQSQDMRNGSYCETVGLGIHLGFSRRHGAWLKKVFSNVLNQPQPPRSQRDADRASGEMFD